jgi:hypothetical protein
MGEENAATAAQILRGILVFIMKTILYGSVPQHFWYREVYFREPPSQNCLS